MGFQRRRSHTDPFRKKSSDDFAGSVVRQRLFWASVLFCSGLALIFRFEFSPERLSQMIKPELQRLAPQADLRFSEVRLSLSSGGFPEIALLFPSLNWWIEGQTCPLKMAASDLKIRLSLRDLLFGELRIGRISASDFQWWESGSRCESSWLYALPQGQPWRAKLSNENATTKKLPVEEFSLVPARKKLSERWPELWRVFRLLSSDRLKIDRVLFQNATINGVEPLELDEFYFVHRKSSWTISSEASFPRLKFLGRPLSFSVQSAFRNDALSLNLSSKRGESAIELRTTFVPKDELQVSLTGSMSSLPVASLNEIFAQLPTLPLPNSSAWINCDFDLSAPLARWGAEPFKVKDCTLTGKYGTINWQKGHYSIEQGPFGVWAWKDFNLEALRRNTQSLAIKQRFPRFGIMNGALTWSGWKAGHAEFTVSNVLTRFSILGREVEQVLNSAAIRARWDSDEALYFLREFRFEGHALEGEIGGRYHFENKTLKGWFDLSKIEVAPSLSRLFFGGLFESMKIKGAVSLDHENQLKHTGAFSLERFTAGPLRLQSVEGSWDRSEKLVVYLRSVQGELALAAAEPDEQNIQKVTSAEGKLTSTEEGYTWQQGVLYLENLDHFKSSGHIGRDGLLTGKLQRVGKYPQTWDIGGRVDGPDLKERRAPDSH